MSSYDPYASIRLGDDDDDEEEDSYGFNLDDEIERSDDENEIQRSGGDEDEWGVDIPDFEEEEEGQATIAMADVLLHDDSTKEKQNDEVHETKVEKEKRIGTVVEEKRETNNTKRNVVIEPRTRRESQTREIGVQCNILTPRMNESASIPAQPRNSTYPQQHQQQQQHHHYYYPPSNASRVPPPPPTSLFSPWETLFERQRQILAEMGNPYTNRLNFNPQNTSSPASNYSDAVRRAMMSLPTDSIKTESKKDENSFDAIAAVRCVFVLCH